MATKKISELIKISSVQDTDLLIIETKEGTRAVKKSELLATLSNECSNLSTQIEVERQRINQFTALGEGSTTGDAELQDIRVGVNGITYDTAGDAVRTQINDIIDNQIDYTRNTLGTWNINLLNLYKTNFTEGYYISYGNGALMSAEGYSASDFIPVVGGSTYITNNTYDQGAYYDADKIYISGYEKPDDGGILVVPESAKYIRMTFRDWSSLVPWRLYHSNTLPDKEYDFTPAQWFFDYVSVFDEYINRINEFNEKFIINLIGDTFTDGYYLNYSTNIVTENSEYCYTNYIPVVPKQTYNFNKNAHICFYDIFKNYVSGILTNNSLREESYFTVPENCYFCIVSFPIATKDIAILNLGDKEIGHYLNIEKIGIKNITFFQEGFIVVDKEGTGDYTSIAEAASKADDGDTIFVKSGTYENEVIITDKKIHILGENKLDTIIMNTSGNYADTPILMGSGSIENITVYAKRDDTTPSDTDNRSYAIHIEKNSLFNDNLLIKDCILKSDFYAPIGMGMRGGCTVLLENIDFILGATAGGTSALYVHDADSTDYVGEQNLIVRNCRIINKRTADRYAIKFQSQEREGTIINLTMQNVYTRTYGENNLPLEATNYYDGVSSNTDDFQGLINWRLSKESYGNSADVFNY